MWRMETGLPQSSTESSIGLPWTQTKEGEVIVKRDPIRRLEALKSIME